MEESDEEKEDEEGSKGTTPKKVRSPSSVPSSPKVVRSPSALSLDFKFFNRVTFTVGEEYVVVTKNNLLQMGLIVLAKKGVARKVQRMISCIFSLFSRQDCKHSIFVNNLHFHCYYFLDN